MPLLDAITTTPKYLHELMDTADVANVITELSWQWYDHADICIQNLSATQIRIDYWKPAVPQQCHRVWQWGSLTLRIIFNISDLMFAKVSLVTGTWTNSNVTYIILPAYMTT